jgi:hypothetical protein
MFPLVAVCALDKLSVWKRTSRALPQAAEVEIEELRRRLKQVEMERDKEKTWGI